MKIVILGKGNMGTPLAQLARAAGHVVESFDSQSGYLAALTGADIVILATKYEQALALADTPEVVAALDGKILVDVTNPLTPDYMGLTVGFDSSAGEQIAQRLPSTKVVKAFNTLFSGLLNKRVAGEDVPVPVMVAGDHASAVGVVAELVGDMGLNPIVAGSMSNARYLEPMAEMMIQLGYGLGHGDQVGFVLVNAADNDAGIAGVGQLG